MDDLTPPAAERRHPDVREVIVVSSPKAGTGAGREQLPALTKKLDAAGIPVFTTTDIKELKQRLEALAGSRVVVVAAGGDGTLALVADNVGSDVPLVPMPFGTENLLARYFGHTSAAEDVFATITGGTSFFLDAGRANGQLFLVMASCGFDAEVVRGLHLRRSGHINRFSYTRPILRALRRYKFPVLNITIDQQDSAIECAWAFAFNLPRYGGGLSIEPGAVGNDGQLDLIAFQHGGIARGLKYLMGIATGRHTRFKDVVRKKAQTIEIHSDRLVPYQLDGDYVGRLPLKIETLAKRVHLLLPSQISVEKTHS